MQGKFQTEKSIFYFVFIDSLAGYRILDWKSFRSLKALLLLILISIVAIEKSEVFEI